MQDQHHRQQAANLHQALANPFSSIGSHSLTHLAQQFTASTFSGTREHLAQQFTLSIFR